MPIFDFLNKNTTDLVKPEESFTPKVTPMRGPGGKFVSKKKPVEPKEETAKEVQTPHEHLKQKTDQTKVQGPFMSPFAGKEIQKFYTDKKWYFAIGELTCLLTSDPPVPPFDQLKDKKELKEIISQNIEKINEIDCADCVGSTKILEEVIKSYNATFPGSLFRWLEDISTLEFVEIEKDDKK